MRKCILSLLLVTALVMTLCMGSVFGASGSTYDSFAQFDKENADGSAVPWKYMYTVDDGVSFQLMTEFSVVDWGEYWYPYEGTYTGLGFNSDVEGSWELNVSNDNLEIAVLAFAAPATGNYKINSFDVGVLWDQVAENFYIFNGSTMVYENALDEGLTVPDMTLSLNEGDVLYFYAKTDGDNWYSAYLSNIVIEEIIADAAPSENPETGDTVNYFMILIALMALTILTICIRKVRVQNQ